MIRYIFKDEAPICIKAADKADPQAIGEALAAIGAKADGALTPGDVVNAARSKESVLHQHFEWDDVVAAEHYRHDQARDLIRLIRVEDEATEDGTSRAFVSVKLNDVTAYRHIDAVRKSADFQMALLAQAERDLEAFERRYQALAAVCKLVSSVRDAIRAQRNNIESRAAA